MAVLEDITDLDQDEPIIEEGSDESDAEGSEPTRPGSKYDSNAPPSCPDPDSHERDGVPLTEDLIRRKAEHNDGCLSTLEEIALHQLDIDKIECLNNCRHLQIVYLQDNLISKIEGLNRLKKLDYLNMALNNVQKMEGLDRCESLRKLDMTCNFIDLDEMHSLRSLKNNSMLRILYLTGNPCQANWDEGYRDWVIATLPQLEELDGKAITRSERIAAVQRLPELEEKLVALAAGTRMKKHEAKLRREEKWRLRREGKLVDDDGTDEWCPDIRVSDARELRQIREDKEEKQRKSRHEDATLGKAPERKLRLFKDDGTPNQCNTAKWPFSIEDDGTNIYVDVALPKFLDSNAIDADVQPTYVRVSAKKQTLQLLLEHEVLASASIAKRSSTTGHLLLTCPRVQPVITSKAPVKQKVGGYGQLGSSVKSAAPSLTSAEPGAGLKGAVDIRSIVAQEGSGKAGKENAVPEHLGGDWSDEEEVPPLM